MVWLAAGSQMVQQQALRDFAQAVAAFFDPGNPAGRPSWTLSTGQRLRVPGLNWREQARLRRLERKLARAKRGSARCGQLRLAIARLKAPETDRRKDWAEKKTTEIARRFDLIKVEDLRITNMTRSAKGTVQAPGRNVNAAINIAAGHAVTARGGFRSAGPVNREPPLLTSLTGRQ